MVNLFPLNDTDVQDTNTVVWFVRRCDVWIFVLNTCCCSAGAGGALQQSEGDGEQRRHPEDEPAQIQQGGGHGRPHLPQRSLRPAQPAREILLQPDLCEENTQWSPGAWFIWCSSQTYTHDFKSLCYKLCLNYIKKEVCSIKTHRSVFIELKWNLCPHMLKTNWKNQVLTWMCCKVLRKENCSKDKVSRRRESWGPLINSEAEET